MADKYDFSDFEDTTKNSSVEYDFSDFDNNDKPAVNESGVLTGLEQGITSGAYEQIAGGLSALGRPLGVKGLGGRVKDIELTSPTLDPEELLNEYRRVRDLETERAEQGQQQEGYLAGNIVGNIANPVNFVPGLNFAAKGAPLLSKAAFTALAKTGAAQGAIQGLADSSADLTKGEVLPAIADTAIGAGVGAVAAPVVGTGLGGLGKLTGGAVDLTKNAIKNAATTVGELFPTPITAASRGFEKINTSKSFDDFTNEAIKDYNDLVNKAVDFYEGKLKLSKAEEDSLFADLQTAKNNLYENQADVAAARGRQSQVDAEKRKVQSTISDLETQNQVKLQEQLKLRQQAEDDAKRELVKDTQKKLKDSIFNKQELEKSFQKDQSQALADLNLSASQDLLNNANTFKSQVSDSYNDINQELSKKGINFKVSYLTEGINDILSSNKVTAQAKKQISDNIDSLLTSEVEAGGEILNLNQIKQIQASVRKLAKSAELSGDLASAKLYNNYLNSTKKYVDDTIGLAGESLPVKLKEADANWAYLNTVQDLVVGNLREGGNLPQIVGSLKRIQPSESGVVSDAAQAEFIQLQKDLGVPTTESAKSFQEQLLESFKAAKSLNQERIAGKKTASQIKRSDEDILNLQQQLESLATKEKLKVSDISTPDDVTKNIQEIDLLKSQLDDLESVKVSSIDDEVQKSLQAKDLQAEIAKRENFIKEYNDLKAKKIGEGRVDALVLADEKAKADRIGKATLDYLDTAITPKETRDRAVVQNMIDEGLVKPENAKRLAEDISLTKSLEKSAETGSLSNRGIAMRLLNRSAYSLGKGARKLTDSTPVEVISRLGGETSKFGKVLFEAAQKGEPAYKAAVNTLLQQSQEAREEFRKKQLIGDE